MKRRFDLKESQGRERASARVYAGGSLADGAGQRCRREITGQQTDRDRVSAAGAQSIR